MKNTLTVLSILALSALAASPAKAVVLANYDFTTNTASGDSEPLTTASTFDDFGWTSEFRTADGTQYRAVQVSQTPSSFDENEYFTFTLTIPALTTVDLTSLTFDGIFENGAVGPVNYFVRSDAGGDAFATNLTIAEGNEVTMNDTLTPKSVSLAAASFQGLSTPVEFRIYFTDGSNNTSTSRFSGVDNVVLNGDITAVPEPSSVALLIGGGCLLVLLRRRQTNRSAA